MFNLGGGAERVYWWVEAWRAEYWGPNGHIQYGCNLLHRCFDTVWKVTNLIKPKVNQAAAEGDA